jgi:23S rRNA (cytidine1920-2'-O)/16S rRNA (cytidine1409-2'-O)-methyltransferase
VRRRLDVELVRRGLAPTRTRAAEAIAGGRVLVGGVPVLTAARQVAPDEAVVVAPPAGDDYVSRGGHKLAAALARFGLDVTGRHAVDVGASTGGFTDCLLRAGAAHVVAIDVGRGQLAWRLRNDPRVTVMERTNVRTLTSGALEPSPDLCVVDVSFISLRTIAPALLAISDEHAEFVLLVKPQFEAGRARVGRGGVVRDASVHEAVLHEVVAGLAQAGLGVIDVVASPLRGADGNVEFLARARRGAATVDAVTIARAVATTVEGP